MLARVQSTLAEIYDVETTARVEDFVCDAQAVRRAVGDAELARGEVLLIAEDRDDVSVGLYVSPIALAALRERTDVWTDERSFEAACLVTEGVSHFVYFMFRAEQGHGLSALELEVQAEVDKYAVGVLATPSARRRRSLHGRSEALRYRLFGRTQFIDGAHTPLGERYRVAHRVASRYTRSLERRYVRRDDLRGLRRELRRFYRQGMTGKLEAAGG